MHLGKYIELVKESEEDLTKALIEAAEKHGKEPDVYQTCMLLSGWSAELVKALKPIVQRYHEEKSKEPDRLKRILTDKKREGATALLRDLQDLYVLTSELIVCVVILKQAAAALRDAELLSLCDQITHTSKRQQSWLLTRMKQDAPQTLIATE